MSTYSNSCTLVGSLNTQNSYALINNVVAQTFSGTGTYKLVSAWDTTATSTIPNVITNTGVNKPTFTAGEFTITESGMYAIGYSVSLVLDTASSRNVFMLVNGTGSGFGRCAAVNLPGDRANATGSAIVKLAVGDKVAVFVFTDRASSLNTAVEGHFYCARIG